MRYERRTLGLAAALLFVGGAAVTAAPTLPEAWTRAQGAARKAWKQGDLVAAGRSLQLAYRVARQAHHPEAARRSLQGLARVYRRLDRPARAQRMLAMAKTLQEAVPAPQATRLAEPAARAVEQVETRSQPPQSTDEALAWLARGEAESVDVALEFLEGAARAQDVRANRILGALYIEGRFVEADMKAGWSWIRRAVELGDVSSMVYQAELLERGLGVPLDLVQARALYRRAAKAGNPVAAHRLGRALSARGEVEEAERWLIVAAEQGRVAASVDLGTLLYRVGGRDGEAADWFHRAASAGDAEARYNLGLCLLQGRGLLADRGLALDYFRQAADAGSRAAQEALVALGEAGEAAPQTD